MRFSINGNEEKIQFLIDFCFGDIQDFFVHGFSLTRLFRKMQIFDEIFLNFYKNFQESFFYNFEVPSSSLGVEASSKFKNLFKRVQ